MNFGSLNNIDYPESYESLNIALKKKKKKKLPLKTH